MALFNTDTLPRLRPRSGVSPTPGVSPTLLIIDDRTGARHAVREFAQGVGWMAEAGNTSDVAALMERFGAALVEYSEKYAMAKAPARLPGWAKQLLVGLCTALLVSLVGGFITYGALQNRVTNLEARTSGIDRLNSLDAKVDLLTGEFERMEARFNAMMDNQAKGRARVP